MAHTREARRLALLKTVAFRNWPERLVSDGGGETTSGFRSAINGGPKIRAAAHGRDECVHSQRSEQQTPPRRTRELLLREPYSCTPVCRIVIDLEPLTSAIGPAGDRLYVPFRITGGSIKGVGSEKRILAGDDFAVMYADEKLMHEGRFVAKDAVGDVLVWYTGASLAGEGAYDDVLDGQLPAAACCRLSIVFVSTATAWRSLTRGPLCGVGSFDGVAGRLNVTVLSVSENDARD